VELITVVHSADAAIRCVATSQPGALVGDVHLDRGTGGVMPALPRLGYWPQAFGLTSYAASQHQREAKSPGLDALPDEARDSGRLQALSIHLVPPATPTFSRLTGGMTPRQCRGTN
jgi:hypothetical protein